MRASSSTCSFRFLARSSSPFSSQMLFRFRDLISISCSSLLRSSWFPSSYFSSSSFIHSFLPPFPSFIFLFRFSPLHAGRAPLYLVSLHTTLSTSKSFTRPHPLFTLHTMILPTALALSLLTLTRALPLTSYSPSQLDLEVSSGSWRYPSFLPSLSDIQQDAPIIKRSIELSLGDEGIVVLDTSASSSDDGSLQEGSLFADNTDKEEEEAVFNPDDYSEGKAVVRNPKAILNPKNPNYSASLAALRPTTSTTTTTTTSSPTQTPPPTTFKGEATYFFQNGVAGACKLTFLSDSVR